MSRVYSKAQKEQKAEYQRRYRQENKDIVLERGRKCERRRKFKRYGITEQEYHVILHSQNNVCGICRQPNSGTRDWHIDHCHETSKVRGILCHHCNLMLGNAKDNVLTLQFAINYLKGTR